MAVQTPDPQFFAIEVKAVFFKNCIPDTEGDLCFVQKLFSLPELGLTDIDEGVRYPTKKDVESFPEYETGSQP